MYDENRAHLLEEVWPAYKEFYKQEKHLRIPRKKVIRIGENHDVNIGSITSHIRNRKDFLQHSDFKKWLDEHGFVYDENRAHLLEEVWPAYKEFYKQEKHLRIPRKKVIRIGENHDVNIGSITKHIRNRKNFLQHNDFAMWLWCGCFEMHTKDVAKNRKRWESVFV